jgi:hypothetical protein
VPFLALPRLYPPAATWTPSAFAETLPSSALFRAVFRLLATPLASKLLSATLSRFALLLA